MPRPTEHGEIWEARVNKLCPVAIVSRDDVGGRRDEATVASITTTIRGLQTEVFVDHRDGLGEPSVVMS